VRTDMHRVLVEEPRIGPRLKGPKGYRRRLARMGLEAAPMRESMRRSWQQGWGKYFGDHVAPLDRFVRSRVGRPWDRVYSEVCREMDRRSLVKLHVHQHLWMLVEKEVELIDGVAHDRRSCRPLTSGFFVCPRTGLLREARRPRRVDGRQASPDVVRVDESHAYHRIDGIWYEIRFVPVPVEVRFGQARVYDMLLRRTSRCTRRANGSSASGRSGGCAGSLRRMGTVSCLPVDAYRDRYRGSSVCSAGASRETPLAVSDTGSHPFEKIADCPLRKDRVRVRNEGSGRTGISLPGFAGRRRTRWPPATRPSPVAAVSGPSRPGGDPPSSHQLGDSGGRPRGLRMRPTTGRHCGVNTAGETADPYSKEEGGECAPGTAFAVRGAAPRRDWGVAPCPMKRC
jgi:hypothetical protein